MKKYFAAVAVLVLTLTMFAGCRSNMTPETTNAPATTPTTRPATQPTTLPDTQPDTEGMKDPTDSMLDDMIPGAEDTIDPSNGANQDTQTPKGRNRMLPRF